MRLASFRHQGRVGFGAVEEGRIRDLSGESATLREALDRWGVDGLRERAGRSRQSVSLGEIEWLPPVTNPDKILCVGLNYHEHAKEAKMEVPQHPSLFVRFPASQVGHLAPVVRPRASHQFDYEAELAVVIGKAGRHISE